MEVDRKFVVLPLMYVVCLLYFLSEIQSVEASEDCTKFNSSCYECIGRSSCYWCTPTKACSKYPASRIIPRDCKKSQWFYKQCTISGFWLIIILPCVAIVVLLTIGCFIYCCCCRTSRAKKEEKYRLRDAQSKREKDQRKAMYAARKAERQEKADEIRKKYGLGPGSQGYQHLDNVTSN